MADYESGIKKEVAEVKFLIHDLRVERFINEVIHFHVTLNTDLEIYSVEQAQIMHGEDLSELKAKAATLRKAYQEYGNAVRNFSPDKTVLLTGKKYIATIYDICELILNPMWGRIDRVLSFLPADARSVQSRSHYRNCMRWICGVYYRIEHFMDEQEQRDVYEEFDLAEDLREFTRNVVYGYVVEKGSARVELQLDRLDSVVLGGNRYRFRRTFFNLVKNAVDAMGSRKVGVLNISAITEGPRIVLRVKDNGAGIPAEKIRQLLTDKETLDGELHSLGFVFVRQTVEDFGGELSIESEVDVGTTVSVSLPYLPDRVAAPRRRSRCEEYNLLWEGEGAHRAVLKESPERAPGAVAKEAKRYGDLVEEAYRASDAEFPGSIFGIAVDEQDHVEFFTHRPYERFWNISHEDLSPMFFQATVRGRLEEDDEKDPVLILKAPQSAAEYFEFKGVNENERNAARFEAMVHDEYIRVARCLIATGLRAELGVLVTDVQKFFKEEKELYEKEPFELGLLARQRLTSE